MEGVEMIEFSDFKKLDLRVAEIIEVENIDGADKLYKLGISLGDETRTICAGIKPFYSSDELKGKKIVVVANLKPKIIKGIESKGMLLAVGNKEEDTCVLIAPEKDVEVGSRVS